MTKKGLRVRPQHLHLHEGAGRGRLRDGKRDAVRLERLGVGAADAVLAALHGVDEVAVLAPDGVALGMAHRAAPASIDHDVMVGHLDGETVGEITRPGLMVLVGATHDDGPAQVATIARKIAELRLFDGPGDDGGGLFDGLGDGDGGGFFDGMFDFDF